MKNLIFILPFLGGVIIAASAMFGMMEVLRAQGFPSVFEVLSLGSGLKVSVALYATVAGSATALTATGLYLVQKGFFRGGGVLELVAAVFGLSTLLVTGVYALDVSQITMWGATLGSVLVGVGGVVSLRVPPTEKVPERFLRPLQVSFTAVFSAVTAILTGLTGAVFPSPTGGYTHIGDAAIYLAALLLGPKVGLLTGIIGPVAADLYVGYSRWFVTVLSHGVQGLVAGFGRDRHIGFQAVFCAFGGVLMAFTYFYVNVFIKGYPVAVISLFRDIFGQTAVSLIMAMFLIKPLERATKGLGR